jgi:4-alpha-glucanotransferase
MRGILTLPPISDSGGTGPRIAPRRASGVLLHPTSLPGPYGIGDLGAAADEFVDFLVAAGQGVWQVLPLGPTGYGDSPYQSFSAFAGNPLLISLDRLVDEGWLSDAVARGGAPASTGSVDYEQVIAHRRAIWPRLLDRLDGAANGAAAQAFATFCRRQAHWLDDFALFMAVKEAHGQTAWTAWSPDIAMRDAAAGGRGGGGRPRVVGVHQLTQ